MDEEYYRQLVKRYLDGQSSDAELEVFAHLLKEGKLDLYLTAALNEEAGIMPEDENLRDTRLTKKRLVPNWLRFSAAAALLIPAMTLLYLRFKPAVPANPVYVQVKNDALPGGNKAVLTLSGGTKIVLNQISNGNIARQGKTTVSKVGDGTLSYQSAAETDTAIDAATASNTLSTPKGGQYQLNLPDGSKVWLNSVSSITFPTAFSGKERMVSITGEAYFEIAKNKKKPFIVSARGQRVQVLGTHFNINAYEDEKTTRTTLLEGSIQITAKNTSRIMAPGQQAEVSGNGIRIIETGSTEAAIAWKNGYFIFDNADLPSLMRQISRWYDVNIIYNGNTGDHEFVGEIKRNTNLSNVIKILELSGIHFKIQDKNLYIQP